MKTEEPVMEIIAVENLNPTTLCSSGVDQQSEDSTPQVLNHEDMEPKFEITAEEVKSIMEIITNTGKFWHDWDMLKRMLSFRLKQVLAEYPESQMGSGDGPKQSSLSGETSPELVKRLDEALLCFVEGPPFTLQRLCEILLNPKSTYKSLSKLALALEKNLLVTTALTICTDPYPAASVQKPEEANQVIEEPKGQPDEAPTGAVETSTVVDADEEMAEAETDENVNADTEMRVCEPSESSSKPKSDSQPLKEPNDEAQ